MESLARHGARTHRPHLFPRQHPRRSDHRAYRASRSPLRLHLSPRHRRSRQPSLHRRHRFRNHHRRHHRHGRKYLPRGQPPPRPAIQNQRRHPRRRPRCRPPHLLLRRCHHRRLPSHLRSHRPRRKTFPSHGGHHGFRAHRRPPPHAHLGPRTRLLLVRERRPGKTQSHLRERPRSVRQALRVVPQ